MATGRVMSWGGREGGPTVISRRGGEMQECEGAMMGERPTYKTWGNTRKLNDDSDSEREASPHRFR